MTSVKAEYMKALAHQHFRLNGILYDSTITNRESLEKLSDYDDIRDDDVIVWTYPKSGTHAAQDIAWKLMLDGDLEKFAKQPSEMWFDSIGPDFISPHNSAATFIRSLAELSAASSPRVILTHVHFELLPKRVKQGEAKIIYVSRNPKDICVSHFEMATKVFKVLGIDYLNWDDFIQMFLDGNDVIYGSWAAHLKDFHAVKDRANVLWVKYEDLVADLHGQVQRMSDFLGRNLDGSTIATIAESCKFESVKKQFPNSVFLRKGVAGGWKDYFTVALSERFDQKIRHDLGEIANEILYW